MENQSIKVVKFGGSSLADAGQFKKVAEIIKSDSSRRYVVPSAPGKRYPEDIKVTDLFYTCYNLAVQGGDVDSEFNKIIIRYNEIIEGLGITLDLSREYENILNSIKHRAGRDYAASRGEYLNGMILAEYLGFTFVEASTVIFFNDNGTLDAEKTNQALGEVLGKTECAVIPGFYGAMPNDTIKTFSRGGSDITGSLVARGVNADLYENWTDVSGFLMADPRIVENPKVIEKISYRELRELSYMGATVLHEDAIFPVRMAGIPINVRNTNHPQDNGTMIVPTAGRDGAGIITGIAGKTGFSVINIEKDMMNSEIGFGKGVLQILEESGMCFEHLPSGIDTMSVIVNTADFEKHRREILDKICTKLNPDTVSVEEGIALIAIVGRNMVKSKGSAARIISAVARAGVNILMIDQGSCEINIILGVAEGDFKEATEAIYNEFYY